MITNPLLEEIWAIKDRLAAEAGNDIHVFCEQLRAWEAAHLSKDRPLHSPQELRAFLARKQEPLAVHEDPPQFGNPPHDPGCQPEK
jgi:hypothetical protein